jgi:hypothetical protein
MKRTVTEQDFRRPEFVGKDVADYEFRDDGKLMRKDRWEMGVRAVVSALGISPRDGFEIDDVVRQVAELVAAQPAVMPAPVVWRGWAGGKCPVDPDVEVAVALVNSTESTGQASAFTWEHTCGQHDIIGYRLIERPTPPVDTEWIEWAGGECPVTDDAFVDIQFAGGVRHNHVEAIAYKWRQSDGVGAIIGYRLC